MIHNNSSILEHFPRRPLLAAMLGLGGALLISGCSTVSEMTEDVLPDRSVDYKKQKIVERNLEIPPDLSRSGIENNLAVPGEANGGAATYSQYQNVAPAVRSQPVAGSPGAAPPAVLPKLGKIQVQKNGDRRWLEVAAEPQQIWPRLVDFWRSNGILLVEEDPVAGVMKTDWIENRADIRRDLITKMMRNIADSLYSAATRDQYRVRLERGYSPGITEVYLTHRGMEEKLVTSTGSDVHSALWVPRPTDPELEATMLSKLTVHLGASEQQVQKQLAQRVERQQISELRKARDGQAQLLVHETFNRSWTMVGVALDRVGFLVEERDRKQGLYFVRYDDPMKDQPKPGFLSKLAFWRPDAPADRNTQYHIKVDSAGDGTQVTVLNAKDEPELSETGVRILTLIHEQLR